MREEEQDGREDQAQSRKAHERDAEDLLLLARPAVRVGDGVELGVHAAFGAPNQATKIPFLTRRLEAVRCAFR